MVFYCLNCLHSENKLQSHKKVCKNKDFRGIVMPPPEKDNILEFNQYVKLDKMLYIIIYAGIESLIKKIDG